MSEIDKKWAFLSLNHMSHLYDVILSYLFLVFLCVLNVLFVSSLFFRKIKQFKISLIMNSNLVIHFSQL